MIMRDQLLARRMHAGAPIGGMAERILCRCVSSRAVDRAAR